MDKTFEDFVEESLMEDPVFREVNLAHLMKFGDQPICTCQFCLKSEG